MQFGYVGIAIWLIRGFSQGSDQSLNLVINGAHGRFRLLCMELNFIDSMVLGSADSCRYSVLTFFGQLEGLWDLFDRRKRSNLLTALFNRMEARDTDGTNRAGR